MIRFVQGRALFESRRLGVLLRCLQVGAAEGPLHKRPAPSRASHLTAPDPKQHLEFSGGGFLPQSPYEGYRRSPLHPSATAWRPVLPSRWSPHAPAQLSRNLLGRQCPIPERARRAIAATSLAAGVPLVQSSRIAGTLMAKSDAAAVIEGFSVTNTQASGVSGRGHSHEFNTRGGSVTVAPSGALHPMGRMPTAIRPPTTSS